MLSQIIFDELIKVHHDLIDETNELSMKKGQFKSERLCVSTQPEMM